MKKITDEESAKLPITLAASPWLLKMSAMARDEPANDNMAIGRDGHNEEVVPPLHVTTPFGKMHAKGQLDSDPAINDTLFAAGTKYYQDWYLSGMNPIAAINYDKVGGGDGSATAPGFMPASERQMQRRIALRLAKLSMSERYASVVEPIVTEGRSTSDVGKESGYANRSAQKAVTMERLNAGLRRLAVHYRIMK